MLEKIFSITKDNTCHKILTIFGLKLRFRSKAVVQKAIKRELGLQKDRIRVLEYEVSHLINHLNGVMRRTTHDFDKTRDNLSVEEHQQNVANLFKNLSETAKNNLQKIISRLDKLYFNGSVMLPDVYNEKELEIIQELRKFRKNTKFVDGYYVNGNYKLPVEFFEPSVLYWRNGCVALQNKKYIKGKTIVDVGCFVADSVLVFREEFPDSKIISFEASPINYQLALKTVELNKLKNVQIENIGLGDKKVKASMVGEGGGSAYIVSDGGGEKISLTTLDSYIKENNISNIGLIKVDIEGFEQKFLQGAKETISSQKPTLLISIYHNYNDFYKIKPLIESWNLGYKFDFFHGTLENTLEDEILLVCEQ